MTSVMETFEVPVVGVTPLLLNAPNAMLPGSNAPRVRKIPTPEQEAEVGTYRLPDGQLYLPMAAFRSAVVEASKGRKVGRMGLATIVRGAVFTVGEYAPLVHPETEKPLTDYEIDTRRAVPPKQGAVMRSRAKLDAWRATPGFEYDPEFISEETITELLTLAGRRVGVGSYRPQKDGWFGRFELA